MPNGQKRPCAASTFSDDSATRADPGADRSVNATVVVVQDAASFSTLRRVQWIRRRVAADICRTGTGAPGAPSARPATGTACLVGAASADADQARDLDGGESSGKPAVLVCRYYGVHDNPPLQD